MEEGEEEGSQGVGVGRWVQYLESMARAESRGSISRVVISAVSMSEQDIRKLQMAGEEKRMTPMRLLGKADKKKKSCPGWDLNPCEVNTGPLVLLEQLRKEKLSSYNHNPLLTCESPGSGFEGSGPENEVPSRLLVAQLFHGAREGRAPETQQRAQLGANMCWTWGRGGCSQQGTDYEGEFFFNLRLSRNYSLLANILWVEY